jgi:hypothetical protein
MRSPKLLIALLLALLSVAAASVPTASASSFPTTESVDTFERAAENPLSNSGHWSKLGWTKTIGRVFSATFGWVPKEGGEGITESEADGAYWNPREFTSPAVSVHMYPESLHAYVALWCDTNGSGTEKNGYRLKVVESSGTSFKLILEKWVAGVKTQLAESGEIAFTASSHENTIGLTNMGGKVQGWYGKTEAGLEAKVEASDSTFTSGHIGIEGTDSAAYGETGYRAASGPGVADTAYPGLEVNFMPKEEQVWEEDAQAGAVVGRASGNLLADAKAAHAKGMKLDFLLEAALPTSLPTTEAKEAETKYPGTLLAIEWGNESYYNGANGKEYAKSFVQAEKEQQTAKLNVPLIMQARLAPDNSGTWMKEVVAYEGIKAALVGNGSATAPQNWIDSHPYGTSMMLAPAHPTELTGSETAYEDTGKHKWGSERWMKEEYFTEKELGITNLPIAVTEYGCAVSSTEGNACGATGEAGYIEKAERAQHYFAFVQKVKEGTVTEGLPATGWKPTLAFASWFEEVTAIEGFGVYYWDSGTLFFKNEQDGFFKKFKEASEAVTKAP